MVPSLFWTLGPPLLAYLAAAAPAKILTIGAADEVDIRCDAVKTVVSYVTVWAGDVKSSVAGENQLVTRPSAPSSPVVPLPVTPFTAVPSPVTLSTRPSNISESIHFNTTGRPSSPQAPQTSAGAQPSGGIQPPTGASYRNALYFTNWGIYGANFQPQQLPVSQISHVIYAFADIGSDGTVKTSDSYADLEKHYATDSWNDQGKNAYGCVKQLYLLKKQNRGMKILLSIGGWTYSPKFAPVAASAAARTTFAQSALTLVKDWGFDGVDIDWEYPNSTTEAQNFVLLLKEVRQTFDTYSQQNANGYHFMVTIAAPAGPTHYNVMDMTGMDQYLDMWNIMAYDYAGSWDTTSGHQANLYNDTSNPTATKFSTDQAISDYIAKGIAPQKINLGLPLYGHSFLATSGLGQPYTGVGQGTVQQGIWSYKDLPRPGAKVLYDSQADASYSYDATGTRELVTYDDVASAGKKAQYLLNKGLGGAFFWEASGDKNDFQSLVGTLRAQMGRLDQTKNLLSYPLSQYDNIRNGMS